MIVSVEGKRQLKFLQLLKTHGIKSLIITITIFSNVIGALAALFNFFLGGGREGILKVKINW